MGFKSNKIILIIGRYIGSSVKKLSKRGTFVLALLVGTGILLFSITSAPQSKSTSTIQDKNNDINLSNQIFKFTDIKKNNYDLSGLKNTKNILLYFFTTKCMQCATEINQINDLIAKNHLDFLILLISPESEDILKTYSINLPLVSDTNQNFQNYFGIQQNNGSETFIFNKNQKLQYISYKFNDRKILSQTFSQMTSTKLFSATDEYFFSIDPKKLQNGCVINDNSKEYTSSPNIINLQKLDPANRTDDLVDCISTITPRFSAISTSDNQQQDVYFISLNGVTKIYPKNILVQHPYIEDKINDLPIGVFYDGLTDNVRAFVRLIDGQETKFTFSGRIYNNHMLLFDNDTYSLWDGGKAIGGYWKDSSMQRITIFQTKLSNLVTTPPSTDLRLMTAPSLLQDYSKDILADYRKSDSLIYPRETTDKNFPVKTFAIKIDDVILDVSSLKLPYNGTTASGKNFLIAKNAQDAITIYDTKVGDNIFTFSNETGVIQNKSVTDLSSFVPSIWNQNFIATSGPLTGNQLEELTFDTGYYYYLATQ